MACMNKDCALDHDCFIGKIQLRGFAELRNGVLYHNVDIGIDDQSLWHAVDI